MTITFKPAEFVRGQTAIIKLRPKSMDLRDFLLRDNGGAVAVKDAAVRRGRAKLLGRPYQGERLGPLYGLNGYPRVHYAIRQEQLPDGKASILYGWADRQDLFQVDKTQVIYQVSREESPGGAWHLLAQPVPLKLSKMQERLRSMPRLREALSQGLGRKTFSLELDVKKTVRDGKVVDEYIYYLLEGNKMVVISGFKGQDKIRLTLKEKNNAILAYCYSVEETNSLQKIAIVSRKIQGSYRPLTSPQIIFANGLKGVQKARLIGREMRGYLRRENNINKVYDFLARVDEGGRIVISMGRQNHYISICGYKQYQGEYLFGRISIVGAEKKVFFWKTSRARETGKVPLRTEGHLMAVNVGSEGIWRIAINSRGASRQRLERTEEARKFSRYLIQRVGERVHEEQWPVKKVNEHGRGRLCLCRKALDHNVFVLLPEDIRPVSGSVYGRAREIGGEMKIVEFWPTKEDCAKNKPAFHAKMLVVYQDNKRFWLGNSLTNGQSLDKLIAKLRCLLKEGKITRQTVDLAISDPYFLAHYQSQAIRITDALDLHGAGLDRDPYHIN